MPTESIKFTCTYCGKAFSRERTLHVHMCEPKRRHLQKHEKWVQNAFMVFQRFYEVNQKNAKTRTYDDFCSSPYYNAFVKFGRHLCSIDAVNPERFIEWVIKNNKKLDHWCKDIFYETYLQEYSRKENPRDALERSIVEMGKWAAETNNPVDEYFKHASENRITRSITNGRISPWAIYTSESGLTVLSRLNEEQIALIYPWIDPDFWNTKLKRYSSDTQWCKSLMAKAGF